MEDYSRRHFVRMSLSSFAGLSLALPRLARGAAEANGLDGRIKAAAPMHWDAFIESVQKEAKKSLFPKWNEDAYVAQVAGLMHRLKLDDPELVRAFGAYKNRRKDFPEIEAIHKERLFQVSLLHFEPGEVIRHHDHPTMTGVLLCGSGSIHVENFDVTDHEASDADVVLRRTSQQDLTAGKISTLTSQERNIHRVTGRQFAQVIDVFTPPYNRERAVKTKWYRADDEPWQGKPGLFAANVG